MGIFHISRQRHLKNSALVWVLVGLMLGVRGVIWTFRDPNTHRWAGVLLPLAVALGLFKGLVVLRKSALKTAERISRFPGRTPFWKLYSPSTYLLILGMMALGFAFRWAGTHWHVRGDVGVLYVVIGVGLLVGSRAYSSAASFLN